MSVYERNGHWYLYVVVNGKRFRKAIKEARTKRQAEKAERVLRDEIFDERYGILGQTLFSDFVENSYKPYAKERKKGFSVELSILNVLVGRFGKRKLAEITTEDIENFQQQRASEVTNRGAKRAKATVNRDIAVLSAVFNRAIKLKKLKINPVVGVDYYFNLPTRNRILSEVEEIILFEYIRDDVKFSRQIEILLYTGFRRGELFKLEWRDIDLNEGYIYLRQETTKTGTARTMPMLSNLKEIFESLRREAGDVAETEKVFSGFQSQPNELSTKFKEICDALGFKSLTLHSLRHTFSTRADEFKVGAFAQKDLLGHAKLSMTARYTHPKKETLKASLEPFEQLISRRNATNAENKNKERPNLLSFKKD